MKIPSYTETPGLHSSPEDKRFSIYRETHKRLLSQDQIYRRRHRTYIAAVVGLVFVPVLGWVAIIYLAMQQQRFQNEKIGEALTKAV